MTLLPALALLTLQPQIQEPLFLPATEPIVIAAREQGEDSWSYQQLLADYMQVTGQVVLVSEEAKKRLETTGSTFMAEIEAPASEVQRIFETLLALENFALARVEEAVPGSSWKLFDLSSEKDGEAIARLTPSVSMDDLSRFQDHPALLVECSLFADGLNAQSFSNAGHGVIARNSYQGVFYYGDMNKVGVRGRATEVSHLVASFLAANFEDPDWSSTLSIEDITGPLDMPLLPPKFEGEGSLLEFLLDYQARTGTVLEIDSSSLSWARKRSSKAVGKQPATRLELQERTERLADKFRFTLYPVSVKAPRIMSIRWVNTGGFFDQDGWMPNRVATEDLPAWAAFPATRIRSEFILDRRRKFDFLRAIERNWKDMGTFEYVSFENPSWVLGIDHASKLAKFVAGNGRSLELDPPDVPTLPTDFTHPATDGFVIPAYGSVEWSYLDLIRDFEESTGLVFERGKFLELRLERIESPFATEVRVPRETAWVVFEKLLVSARLMLGPGETTEQLRLWGDYQLDEALREASVPVAKVSAEELGNWRSHPAYLIECVIPCGIVGASSLGWAAVAFGDFWSSHRTEPDDQRGELWMMSRAGHVLETFDLLSWAGGEAVESSQPHPLLEAFGRVEEPFTLRASETGETLTLLDWIEQVEYAAGTHFLLNEWAREEALKISADLPVGLTIPAGDAMKSLEQFCSERDFIFFPVHSASPRIVEIVTMRSVPGELPRIMVGLDALEEWRDHPAVTLQTAMHVPAKRLPELTFGMRGSITNANYQQILMVGETLMVLWNSEPLLREQVAFLKAELGDSTPPTEPK